ncbi:MAG: hypothetical protein ACFE0O_02385 [Opitutales bacterium]
MGKLKKKCCHKYLKKKKKACKNCPLMAGLTKRERKERIKALRKGDGQLAA